MRYADDMPVGVMTIGDLRELIAEAVSGGEPPADGPKNLVYGLRGIQQLLGVSHTQAQRYKDTILKPAVSQNGRKIVVDADMALRLFAKKDDEKGGSQ